MKRLRLPLFAVSLAVAAIAINAPAGGQIQLNCSASFHVQHNDRIGSLRLPEGAYQLSVTGMSCLRASQLFAEFLQDWNGKLPPPWRGTTGRIRPATGRKTCARNGATTRTCGRLSWSTRPAWAA